MSRILTIVILLVQSYHLCALDFYWKGGSGDFNDASNWYIGSVAGPSASQAPISTDNVFFSASTINTGSPSIISINSSANCQNFWIDTLINASSTITFTSGNTQTLDIYGSFELATNVNFNFIGVLRFRSVKNGIEIIKSAGTEYVLDHIEFDGGPNTVWLLKDSLVVDDNLLLFNNWDWVVPTGSIMLYNGTLNSNKQTILTDFFYATNNSPTRGIVFDSSSIVLRGFNGGDAKGWWIDFDTATMNFSSFSVVGAELIFDQTNGLKQYGSFGYGMQYDKLIGNNELSVSGSCTFNHLETNGSTYFIDSKMGVSDLYLSPKHEHYFNCTNLTLFYYLNYYLEIDSFHSPTNCNDFITLRGYAKTKGTIRKKTSGTLSLDQVILENMNCDVSGGKSYVLNNSIDDGGNTGGWTFNNVAVQKMKYVGTGNHLWSDPNNWEVWDGATWVANTQNCVPNPFTDVYVDVTSFPPSGTRWIVIDSVSMCRDLIWDNATYTGATIRVYNDLHVFGSAEFGVNMNPFQGSYSIFFHGQNNTLKSNGVVLPKLVFWKYADYYIQDDLEATKVQGWVFSRIRAANISITTTVFSLGERMLNNVLINLTGTFYDFGGDQIDYLGNTTFNFTDTSGTVIVRRQKNYAYSNSVYLPNIFSHGVYLDFDGLETILQGDLETYGDVRFRVASMNITGSMTNYSGKLILHEGNFAEIKNLSVADSFISKGSCNNMITLRPYGGAVGQVNLNSSGIESTFIQGLNNIGAPAQTTACVDGGSNSNWVFNLGAPQVYYWRASALDPSDYEGDWSDPNHWTTNVNDVTGTNGGCMPTLADSVIFDNQSFSASSNGCNIDNIAYCNTFICNADITITGDELYVGGSFHLANNMSNFNQTGVIYFVGEGLNVIDLNNTMLKNCGVVFNNTLGDWSLVNDFHIHDSVSLCYTGLVLDAGTFRLNGYTLTIQSRFRADRTTAYRVLDIRNSTIEHLCNDRYNSYYGYTWDISNSTNMQLLSDNSTINFNDNNNNYSFTKIFYMGPGLTYDNVNFLDNDNYMKVYNDANYGYAYIDGTTFMYGSNSYDSIKLIGGYQWFLKTGKTQTLASEYGKILAQGDASNFVYIESTTAGQSAYIHKEYGDAFCIDYVKVKDIHATKGLSDPVNPSRHAILFFQTGLNSDNINGSATGIWAFVLPPGQTVNISLPVVYQKICNGGAPTQIPISLTGTYPYVVELIWTNDLGQSGVDTIYLMDDDNNVNTPYNTTVDLYPVSNTSYTVQASGIRCGVNSFFSNTGNVIVALDTGLLVDSQSYGSCDLNNLNEFTHFFDTSTVRPMVSVMDKVNAADVSPLGIVDSKIYFDSYTKFWNLRPYLKRHWLIDSEFAGPLKIRLYFNKDELDSLAFASYGTTNIDLQQDLLLIHFPDTILTGTPDTVPFTVIPLIGPAAVPFSSAANTYAIEFQVSSLSAFLITTKDTSVILPLDLLSFNAEKQGESDVLINWQTEQNNDINEFVLERSKDAVFFDKIYSENATLSPGLNNYSFIDGNPLSSINYYRLKTIDHNGDVNYSAIKSVLFDSPVDEVLFMPNPADNEVNVVINSVSSNDLIIDVFDIRGVRVMSQVVDGKVGKHTIELATYDWLQGVYAIRISDVYGWASVHKLRVRH